VKFGEMI